MFGLITKLLFLIISISFLPACDLRVGVLNNNNSENSNPPICKVTVGTMPQVKFEDYDVQNVWAYGAQYVDDRTYVYGSGGIYEKNSSGFTSLSVGSTDSFMKTSSGTVLIGQSSGTNAYIRRMGSAESSFTTQLTATDAIYYRAFRQPFQAKDGKIFFSLSDRYAAAHFRSKIFMSEDDGLTWSEVGAFLGTPPATITITGIFENSHGIWAVGSSRNWATWGARTEIFYKWDGATNWIEQNRFSPNDPGTGFNLNTGSSFISWIESQPVIVANDAFYMSRWVNTGTIVYKVAADGMTGEVISYFPHPSAATGAYISRVVADQSGRLFVAKSTYSVAAGKFSDIEILVSEDSGTSWNEVGSFGFTNTLRDYLDYGIYLNFDRHGELHVFADTSDVAFTVGVQGHWTLPCTEQ